MLNILKKDYLETSEAHILVPIKKALKLARNVMKLQKKANIILKEGFGNCILAFFEGRAIY
jgi:hypothetical protein